jgi:hypothetical protein
MTKLKDMTLIEKQIRNVVGLRSTDHSFVIDQPCEYNYHCPICKYRLITKGKYDERLQWSEFNGFLWCSTCKKDYPSVLCLGKDIDRAIEIYVLSILRQI